MDWEDKKTVEIRQSTNSIDLRDLPEVSIL